uniref:ubiquitin carboxyl-terminal hydrolase MINDY-3 n=1 Tax=Doryrhamphus excisus TaxID=161450 RepID=UPI0025AE93FF|nr:ubiquitin carboxyl-terminal hydrolase MINDY-3 [Doryrhamphus excisus]XP_057941153.1 ubiquitin carboxyl-terminal hydrolase MINDY-3 [Doryrhamphus excisus]
MDAPEVTVVMSELNEQLVDLVWGRPASGGVSDSIFRRWTQGFVFSENEHTALEQFEGGPCAVIVPVQAFLLKSVLFNRETINWRHMPEEEQKTVLCSTLSEILESACSGSSTGFCLVTWAKGQSPDTLNAQPPTETQDAEAQDTETLDTETQDTERQDAEKEDTEIQEIEDTEIQDTEIQEIEDTEIQEIQDTEIQEIQDTEIQEVQDSEIQDSEIQEVQDTETQDAEIQDTEPQNAPEPDGSQPPEEQQQPTALAAEDLGFEQFHSVLHKRAVMSVSDLKEEVLSLYHTWKGCCGVLLFLYSVILTKGIDNIKNEIQDTTEPLIDPVHGHGSQSLVNLLVTGHAVSNVWDGERECSGMKLHGIHKQASVGFLTLMESLRYCKVGAFLKSPQFPIWILGSETHLSVFFTKEMSLVGEECPAEQARRVFQSFDPEDNGFIADTLLEEVMKALGLVSEPEYVRLVRRKLDPEGLGIILLGPFLLEFFPNQDSGIPDSFPVYHYNGLKQSNHNERVEYVEGTALVLGFEDPMVRTDDTPVKRCLQTKWPYIELLWTTERSPSLN